MSRLATTGLIAAVLMALAPSAAHGVTLVGAQTDNSSNCPGNRVNYMRSAPYVVPTDGVVTEMTLRGGPDTSGQGRGVVVRRTTGTSVRIIGVGETENFDAVLQLRSGPASIPVKAGDWLGIHVTTQYNCFENTGSDSDLFGVLVSPPSVDPGDEYDSDLEGPGSRLSVSAVVEADGDGDGFGDESQDACPFDPTKQAAPCTADVAATIALSPAAIEVGEVAAVLVNVRALNGGARNAVANTALPATLQLLSSAPACGTSCPLGNLRADESRDVALIVRGAQAGAQTVAAIASQADAERDTSNDRAEATLNVTAPPVLTPPPVAVAQCRVPSARGLTRAIAKRLFEAAGCRLGTVRRRRVRRGPVGRVVAQRPAARTRVALGTRVQVTITSRARRRRG